MKKLKISLFILFLLITTISAKDVFAATNSDMLISLGTGRYQITVNKTTTVDQIINVLGEPKLVTDSAFGGYAYTFYTDNNYSNYLYIETLSDGQIFSYGSIDETYKTNTYSYGDNYPYSENTPLYGCLLSNDSIVGGGVYYNRYALLNGDYGKIMDFFEENYMSNPIKYLKGLSKQGILMYNAMSLKLGNKDTTPLVFDEDFLYINEQFKEFGTSIREYMKDMDINISYMKSIGTRSSVDISSVHYMLNPIMFANMAVDNKYTVFDNKTIAVFDYDIDRKILSAIALSKDAFNRSDKIVLTDEEKLKLTAGRAEYTNAMSLLKNDSTIYELEPVSTIASALVAGKLTSTKEEGILSYINAIRIAAGLPKYEKNDVLYNVAQHKATLLSYRYQVLGLGITHSPDKPSGVSDAFYNTAMGNGYGYAECVGINNKNIRWNEMVSSIDEFIDDSAEYPQTFSHRLSLLSSKFKYFGYGISPYVSATEFSGVNQYDNCLEAWPAEGVTFMESLAGSRFQWTARFVNKYTILDSTTATVKCLNTGEIWEFKEQENNNNRWFGCHTDTISSLNNKVVIYDSSIVPQPGYVYEITLHGIKEDSTSKNVDYTYRSVFEYADVNNYPSTLDRLSIKIPESTDFKYDEDEEAYMIPIGEEINLDVDLDLKIIDKKVTWRSSNDKVKVTQNGIIYADELLDDDETAIISVSYDGNNITDEIIVKPYKKLNEIILDKQEMECQALGEDLNEPSFSLYIEYIPSDANEVKEVHWKIVSKANKDIEYDMDDEYIKDYVKIQKDSSDSRKVYVYAVTAELNNNKYDIIAEVKGISGTYTGKCNLTINVPIDYIKVRISSIGPIITGSVLDINYNSYNKNTFDVYADIYPQNATYDKTIEWTIDEYNGVISKNSNSVNYATFNILKEGETTLTAKSINGKIDTVTVRISSEIIKLVLRSNSQDVYINSNIYPNISQLYVTREPLIDADTILYESSDSNIAHVDSNGLVTFENPGTVTITAYSEEKPTVKDEVEFNVYSLISDIYISAPDNVTINKGDIYTKNIYCLPANNSFSDKITYKSSDPSVAIVGKNGEIIGIGPGNTIITASVIGEYTTTGTTKTVSYMVNVKAPIEDIDVQNPKTIIIGQKSKLTVDVFPKNTTSEYSIRWESLNPDILQIDEITGEVTSFNLGTGIVRVEVNDLNTGNLFTRYITVNVVDYLKGDMNKDGAINSLDAAIIIDKYKSNIITDEDYAIGDMDENNTLNSLDAGYIIDLYKKNVALE